jgi:hypothetical protein
VGNGAGPACERARFTDCLSIRVTDQPIGSRRAFASWCVWAFLLFEPYACPVRENRYTRFSRVLQQRGHSLAVRIRSQSELCTPTRSLLQCRLAAHVRARRQSGTPRLSRLWRWALARAPVAREPTSAHSHCRTGCPWRACPSWWPSSTCHCGRETLARDSGGRSCHLEARDRRLGCSQPRCVAGAMDSLRSRSPHPVGRPGRITSARVRVRHSANAFRCSSNVPASGDARWRRAGVPVLAVSALMATTEPRRCA